MPAIVNFPMVLSCLDDPPDGMERWLDHDVRGCSLRCLLLAFCLFLFLPKKKKKIIETSKEIYFLLIIAV